MKIKGLKNEMKTMSEKYKNPNKGLTLKMQNIKPNDIMRAHE